VAIYPKDFVDPWEFSDMRALRGRVLGTVLALPVLLSAAACGGDDDKKAESTPTPPASVPPSAAPTSAAPPPSSPAAGGKSLTVEQLKAAVLTSSDVPRYAIAITPSEDTPPEKAEKPDCQPLMDLFSLQSASVKATAAVEGALKPVDSPADAGGTSFAVMAYADGGAAKLVKAGVDAAGGCAQFNATDAEGVKAAYTVAKTDQAKLGDEAVAFKVAMTGGEAPAVLNVVTVRVGDALTSFITASAQGSPEVAPDQAVVTKQVEKLQAAAKA
jgi:hypothetical protein